MKRSDFDRFPLKEKVYRVLESGRPIADRLFLYFQIRLYTFGDFFVEVWYIPSTNKIDRIESLDIDDVLKIYDSKFNISDLLK